jgi:hypothetical protein
MQTAVRAVPVAASGQNLFQMDAPERREIALKIERHNNYRNLH